MRAVVVALAPLILAPLVACGSGGAVPDGALSGDASGVPVDAAGVPGDAAAPTWSSELASATDWTSRAESGGAVTFGLADPAAADGAVGELRLAGDPALGNGDHVGPAFASELETARTFGFGTYRARVQLARCAAGEEAVNGIFTFFNDGTDHDGDQLVDNAEIDIEILCATPNVVFLSSWIDYDETSGAFRKWTRAIDLATGDLYDSPSDHEYGLVPAGHDAALAHPGFPDPSAYYELGWDWRADALRFVIVIDGREQTLWTFTNAALIPQLPGQWMLNVWHPDGHWFGDQGAPDYPAHDAAMRVDWVRYWQP